MDPPIHNNKTPLRREGNARVDVFIIVAGRQHFLSSSNCGVPSIVVRHILAAFFFSHYRRQLLCGSTRNDHDQHIIIIITTILIIILAFNEDSDYCGRSLETPFQQYATTIGSKSATIMIGP
jgi:hypothetical protein